MIDEALQNGDDSTLEQANDQDLGQTPVQEKMIPASRVEELIKKAKLKGRDAMQDELDRVRRENEMLKGQGGMSVAPVATAQSVGNAQPYSPDQIKAQVVQEVVAQLKQQQDEYTAAQMRQEGERVANEYMSKMSSGKSQFDDFDDVMSNFNPAAHPNLVYLANQAENTPAVMYELQKNPGKFASVAYLSERDPVAAQNMINKISLSIKNNDNAKAQEKSVNAPLNRMQSSTTGQDSGGMTIADFKRKYRV